MFTLYAVCLVALLSIIGFWVVVPFLPESYRSFVIEKMWNAGGIDE
jgi:hypothetical protein